jgi:hypothetical protein
MLTPANNPYPLVAICYLALATTACGSDKRNATPGNYVLSSVVIDAEGNRTTYVQTIPSLEDGPFTNATAIEVPGNGVVIADDKAVYVGLAEEPTWIRYSLHEQSTLRETGRMSLLNYGAPQIDYGNAIVDAQTAVSVLSDPPRAVIWNPSTMTITGDIDLSFLKRDGYELEVWTTVAHDGLVYIPGRWSDWEGGRIYPNVSTTVIDPKRLEVLGTATDERCASGGRVVFSNDGYAYVMGDGRTYSIQMFANAAGTPPPKNCLLRIAPGTTSFEQDYFYTIESLTGGFDSIDELDTPQQSSGVAITKMFYPDQLPEGVEPVDFGFWSVPAFKMWSIELANPPTARVVDGAPFANVGFSGVALDGHLYTGETADGQTSDVYEMDPATNSTRHRFTMDGYFYGLYRLSK